MMDTLEHESITRITRFYVVWEQRDPDDDLTSIWIEATNTWGTTTTIARQQHQQLQQEPVYIYERIGFRFEPSDGYVVDRWFWEDEECRAVIAHNTLTRYPE